MDVMQQQLKVTCAEIIALRKAVANKDREVEAARAAHAAELERARQRLSAEKAEVLVLNEQLKVPRPPALAPRAAKQGSKARAAAAAAAAAVVAAAGCSGRDASTRLRD